jgi:ABC-type transport system involved in multi-copper enzyme maturation permease subunit
MNAIAQSPKSAERPGLIGPLFFWEVVRQSRKRSLFWWRIAYATSLLAVLYVGFGGGEVSAKESAVISESLTRQFLIAQFVAVLILTPLFVAGALLEDRQNNTLMLLLTTFLTAREIVLGKLATRLLLVLGVLLTGLPVLALLVLLGGVDFFSVLAFTALALVLMVLCGMFAIHASGQCRTVAGAIFKTYTAVGLTVGGLGMLTLLFIGVLPLFLLTIFVTLFRASNLLRKTIQNLERREESQGGLSPVLYQAPSFHEFDAPEKTVVIPYERRNTELDWSSLPGRNDPAEYHVSIRHLRVPSVYAWPLLWKDSFFPLSYGMYAARSLGSCLLGILYMSLLIPMIAGGVSSEFFQGIVPLFMLLPLVLVTLDTAGSFSSERRQNTLESLLSLPWPLSRILLQKWAGSLWRYRHFWALLSIILMTLLFYFPTRWPILILLFVSQILFWSSLGLALSCIWWTPWQSQAAVAVLLFLTIVVLPNVLHRAYASVPSCAIAADDTLVDRRPDAQLLLLITCPYDAWSLLLRQEVEWERYSRPEKVTVNAITKKGYPYWGWPLNDTMKYAFLGTSPYKAIYTMMVLALLCFIGSYCLVLRGRKRWK